jgi:hypothetical protein
MESEKTFFSYARDDSEFVLKLAKDLRAAGVDVWLDQVDIPVGKNWDDEIQGALANAQAQIVVLSPSSVNSRNVMDEVSYALGKGKHVVPILLKDCKIPFRLERVQHINFTSSYDTGFNKLLKSLNLEKTKEPEMVTSISEEDKKQKLEREAEQKRKEQLKQETKLKPSLDKAGSTKWVIGVALLIVVIVSIIVIINSGDGEQTSITNGSEQTNINNENEQTDPLENEWQSAVTSNSIDNYISYIVKYGDADAHYDEAQIAIDDLLPWAGIVTYKDPEGQVYFVKNLYFNDQDDLLFGQDDGTLPKIGDLLNAVAALEVYDYQTNQLIPDEYIYTGQKVRVVEVSETEDNYVYLYVRYADLIK